MMSPAMDHEVQVWRAPSRAEEIELFESWYQDPDNPKVKERFIEAYIRFIRQHANRYARQCRHLTVDDLIQEGVVVMFEKAIPRYDLEMGFRFPTYLGPWLRQAMQRAIDNLDETIRLPVHMSDKRRRVRSVAARSELEYGERVSTEDISRDTDVSPDQVELLLATSEPLSLDSFVGDDEEERLGNFVPTKEPQPIDRAFLAEYRQLLDELLEHLTARERFVLENRYGLDGHGVRILEVIGHELGISRERVRQIEARAIKKLLRIARRTSICEVI